ncbi:MAG: hypothetical protein ACK2UK_09615 [Candidatus Promineifilaceae bacterium]|jgi:hypothetical protein
MTENVLQIWPEIWAVLGGIFILLVFALALAVPQRPKTLPGSQGHRLEDDDDAEEIRADGYIDSFAKDIEEAGGGMPPIVKLALPGIILWWLIYLVLNWSAG